MGQPITVTEKATSRADVVRYELNRGLTGMGHLRYRSPDDATGPKPPDLLARRLFDRDGVRSVHVYSNEVTVEFAPGASRDGIADDIRELFIHYREGVTPKAL